MGFLAPVFTWVGGFLGTALGKAVVGLGLNYALAKMEQRRAKKAQAAASGVSLTVERGEDVSRKVLVGLVGIAGHDCYSNTYDSSNKWLENVYVFSDYPCDGLSRIWVGGTALDLAVEASDTHSMTLRVASGEYAGLMSFRFYYGTHTAADAGLIQNSNPAGRWTDKHRGSGTCYIIARMLYDQEKLSQFPTFFFEVRGARLYDIRKDSTAGGFGPHRWGDYSTHEYSDCPIVADYNYRRGFVWGADATGRPDLFCGMDMPASDLPFDKYVTASNICDEIVDGERRYRCSIILDAGIEHRGNIDPLMASCGGIVIDGVEGSWPLIGSEQPIVATFTDDDFVAGEQVRFRRFRSQSDLINSVSGTYSEPGNMYSPAGYDVQTNAATVVRDRRSRDVPINFPQVSSKRQANQLASIYFNENRFEKTADIVLPPRFRSLKAGDWVAWDSEDIHRRGVYMIQGRAIRALDSDGPRNLALSLQERSGEIYAGTGTLAPVFPLPIGQPVFVNELQDLQIIAVLGRSADGRTVPAFRIAWTKIDDVTVDGVLFRWWHKDQPENKFQRQATARDNILFIQEGILSETEYVFDYVLIAPTRTTLWSERFTVKSLDGGNDDRDVYLADLDKSIRDVLSGLMAEMDDQRPLLERLLANFQHEALSSEIARRRLQSSVDRSTAFFQEEIAVVTNAVEAAAAQVTTIGASVGEVSANGLVRFAAAANATGVDARFAVAIRGSVNGAFKETGFFLELYTVGGVQRSRFAVSADQFVISNGDARFLPIVFENGELKLAIANIGTVTAGVLRSRNGKMVINLDAGTIVISS
ncbi:phage tail protein [Rhizobium panacihumi]|uniref:phage tail protein n=1 Tax=Rhizobium panacihumi TaxID=2008450 RepID=UPI003D7AD0C7